MAEILIYDDYDALSKRAADIVVEQIANKPNSAICFPSGDTPTGMLKYLVGYALDGAVNFDECRFVGLDEWVGLDKDDEGSCSNYLYANFFTPANISPENIIIFNGRAADMADECSKMNAWLQANGPLDMMIVGVGLNGHIGLNEPGSCFEDVAHVSTLAMMTITSAQKYFTNETTLSQGITLGLKNFQEAKVAILMASGAKKAPIMADALEGEISTNVPASIMQKLENGVVMLDEAAASLLSGQV